MSVMVPISVKWGKQVVDVIIDPSIGVMGLKNELEEKTSVPASRQKILAKSKGLWKGVLKDDADFESIDWKAALSKSSPLQVLLMGSAEDIKKPSVNVVFLEDLKEEELAQVAAEPSGLVNLGNTCYLNSVIQCLRAVPEFQRSLKAYSPSQPATTPKLFVGALKDTFARLNATEKAMEPLRLVQATKLAFPQFAQLSRSGHPMQQDSEEFYSGLLTLVAGETKDKENLKAALPYLDNYENLQNTVDTIFGMKLREKLTCDEDESEPPVLTHDWHRKLTCNIQANDKVNVSYIAEGIQLSLSGKIEKHSDILNRNAVWTRQQKIAKLPLVLTVQFGRFYWKATPDSADHAGVKCKVMKPVAFSDTLDIYDFCTDEIQAILKQARDKALAAEEDAIQRKLRGDGMQVDHDTDDKKEAANGDNNKKEEEDDKEDKKEEDEMEVDDEELQKALAMSMQQDDTTAAILGPGFPADFQGIYELFAVVTHKGRDADGGHYMAWVKAEQHGASEKIADTDIVNEDWFVFDDDSVSPCKTEDVLKLKGGGDWHMSYLNFYRIKK